MPPLDSRKDSGEMLEVKSGTLAEQIHSMLGDLKTSMAEVRASQKGLDIKVDGLTGSHAEHRQSLHNLGSTVAEMKVEIGQVRVIAERADEKANKANAKISDTVHSFETTMSAVNASQNLVAQKAELVERKTDAIATETIVQTRSLATLAAVNTVQTSMLEKIRLYQPVVNILAVTVATAAAYALNAWHQLGH
jgi:chromosome segregation ATPase